MAPTPSPKRLLVTAAPDDACALLTFVKDLTGAVPQIPNPDGPVAGVVHDWSITTKYYSTTVTLWLDEVTNPSAWVSDFLSDEAAEVITALGGWVYCFRKPATRDEFDAVKSNLAQFAAVSEKLDEGCCLAVALRQPVVPSLTIETDEWDDLCIDHGFEFVDLEASGETEFGEKTGLARVKEALEANDWLNQAAGFGDDNDNDSDGDDPADGLDFDIATATPAQIAKVFGKEGGSFPDRLLDLEASLDVSDEDDDDDDDGGEESKRKQVDEMDQMIKKIMNLRQTNGGSANFSPDQIEELKTMMEGVLFKDQSRES